MAEYIRIRFDSNLNDKHSKREKGSRKP
jgi:hypothetical protein